MAATSRARLRACLVPKFFGFWLLATVALSFLFGKNCPIMNYLGLKDLSHDFSANCIISFFSSIFSTPCMGRKI